MNEGIYFGMPAAEYHAAPALSHSGMKVLNRSPLHYWQECVNPARGPGEASDSDRFGTALHCLLLEPEAFSDRYCLPFREDDHPGALDTVEDLKGFLRDVGLKVTGNKPALIDRVRQFCADTGASVTILEQERADYARQNAGKILLRPEEYDRVQAAAAAARSDRTLRELLDLGAGVSEVSIFVRDEETGVMLKCRLDYMAPRLSADLKSFRCKRSNRPLSDLINSEIEGFGYDRQAVWYHDLRELAASRLAKGTLGVFVREPDLSPDWLDLWKLAEERLASPHGIPNNDLLAVQLAVVDSLATGAAGGLGHVFAFAFVESEPPYALDNVVLSGSACGGQPEEYWPVARETHRRLIRLYRDCLERWGLGETAWREPVRPRALLAADLPRLAYLRDTAALPSCVPDFEMEASEL